MKIPTRYSLLVCYIDNCWIRE